MAMVPTLPIGRAAPGPYWKDRCIYCGEAQYDDIVFTPSVPVPGHRNVYRRIRAVPGYDIRLKRCPKCGHTLCFLDEEKTQGSGTAEGDDGG